MEEGASMDDQDPSSNKSAWIYTKKLHPRIDWSTTTAMRKRSLRAIATRLAAETVTSWRMATMAQHPAPDDDLVELMRKTEESAWNDVTLEEAVDAAEEWS
jgi:hypothetical protein